MIAAGNMEDEVCSNKKYEMKRGDIVILYSVFKIFHFTFT
jgi:hypothetical protein